MRNKGAFNNIVSDIRQMGDVIEHTAEALESKGVPEKAASYAATMAFLRSRRK